jgi:hypothetical protein
VRKRLLNSGPLTGGLPLEGMTFTVMDGEEVGEDSPTAVLSGSMLGETLVDEESSRMALSITPPATPVYGTPSSGSPTLAYGARTAGKDASGTRRMMLKRKSSSLLRLSASQQQLEGGLQRSNGGKSS